MIRILTIVFLSLCFGCVGGSKKSETVSPSMVNDKEILVDWTHEVIQYNDIVFENINKVIREYTPDYNIISLDVNNSNKFQTDCVQKEISRIENRYKTILNNDYTAFAEKLRTNFVPYEEYLFNNIDKSIYQTHYLNDTFFKSIPTKNGLSLDLSRLELGKKVGSFTKQPVLEVDGFSYSRDYKQGFTLDVMYNYSYMTPFSKFKKEKLGIDKYEITFQTESEKEFIKIKHIAGDSIHVLYDINELAFLIKESLVSEEGVVFEQRDHQNKFISEFQKKTRLMRDEIGEGPKRISDTVNTLSALEDNRLFCLLFGKNLKAFESYKDVSIKAIFKKEYKGSKYLNLDVWHLNILNNANIKLNDSYKISRYLFDHIIRAGLRIFSDTLHAEGISGISFTILSSENNFIRKDDPEVIRYQFYLPKKEILQYVNDDITGKKLAESSYILVNGERIELK